MSKLHPVIVTSWQYAVMYDKRKRWDHVMRLLTGVKVGFQISEVLITSRWRIESHEEMMSDIHFLYTVAMQRKAACKR